jgi:hypothetical protein
MKRWNFCSNYQCLNVAGGEETEIFEKRDEQRNDVRDAEYWCAITIAFMENESLIHHKIPLLTEEWVEKLYIVSTERNEILISEYNRMLILNHI